jgi:hypothetical protein
MRGGNPLSNYYLPHMSLQHGGSGHGYHHYRNEERFVPGLGLGLGFLGGLATGALLTPGPGFGYAYRPPYPYYYPYAYPTPYYGYPYYR